MFYNNKGLNFNIISCDKIIFYYRCGKRKRSCRERSTDCDMRSLKPNRNTKSKNRIKMQTEDGIDCSRISSSSISSSDSEAGLITNDEDREGIILLICATNTIKLYN